MFTALDPSLQWGWSEILTNKITYLLEILAWQNSTPDTKGKMAAHKRRQPKPFVPDFMKPKTEPSEISKEADTMTVDDVKSWLSVERGV